MMLLATAATQKIATAKVEATLLRQADDSYHPGFGKSDIG
jgi:hypothetical protein